MNRKEVESNFINMVYKNERVIYKFCSVYCNSEYLISDLYKDVIINLWNSYPKFENRSSESTWIYRVALNTCINHVRKDIRRPQKISLSNLQEMIREPESLDPYLKELYRLIHQLQPIEKAIILLWLEEKSYQEIAEITGLSLSNIATKLKRSKIKLKDLSNK